MHFLVIQPYDGSSIELIQAGVTFSGSVLVNGFTNSITSVSILDPETGLPYEVPGEIGATSSFCIRYSTGPSINKDILINGDNNFIHGSSSNLNIFGNNNDLGFATKNISVHGNNNIIEDGLEDVFIIGNNLNIKNPGIYINSSSQITYEGQIPALFPGTLDLFIPTNQDYSEQVTCVNYKIFLQAVGDPLRRWYTEIRQEIWRYFPGFATELDMEQINVILQDENFAWGGLNLNSYIYVNGPSPLPAKGYLSIDAGLFTFPINYKIIVETL